MAEPVAHGACLCGEVTFSIAGELREVIACHCGQCRRTSGHFWASTAAPRAAVHFEKDATLRWFQSSEKAARGFCAKCGASLFWSHSDRPTLSIAAGALEVPTGLKMGGHIFFADASDYYRIHPDEPVTAGSSVEVS